MAEISAVNGPDEVNNELLRSRAKNAARADWGNEYFTACIDSSEVALLVLDYYPRTESAGIHEIFVLEPYRKQGLGTDMLEFAEARARKLGRRAIELQVFSLDQSFPDEVLRAWYVQHGYEGVEGRQGVLHKVF